MSQFPTEWLVDALRIDLAHMRCRRVVLLGNEGDMGVEGLRVALARWGFQVLVPPEDERAWIAGLSSANAASLPDAELRRLAALLSDTVEHGVDAIVTTEKGLARLVEACRLEIPTLALDPRGSVVPVRNVVFDMGGVLFRWEPLGQARRFCESDEDVRLLADAVFGSVQWALMDAGAVDEGTVAWTAKARLPRRLHAAVNELVRHWCDERVPVEGMGGLIGDLKQAGYGIYLLTNAGEPFERYEAQLPGRECFDGMVVSYRERVVKPDARIYRTLLERYGLEAGECLLVDDARDNVLGARMLGMRAWHFDGTVQSLRDLLL